MWLGLIALTHKSLCIDLHGSLYKNLMGFRQFAKKDVIVVFYCTKLPNPQLHFL